jgi:hypothetical protein
MNPTQPAGGPGMSPAIQAAIARRQNGQMQDPPQDGQATDPMTAPTGQPTAPPAPQVQPGQPPMPGQDPNAQPQQGGIDDSVLIKVLMAKIASLM